MKEFQVPLRLTSPLTRGPKVRDAQFLLHGGNRFTGLAPYKDGQIDGIYGPTTAASVKRAKYWLGYPESSIDATFGQTIYEYLRVNHWRELPRDYQKRRADRIAAAAQTPGSKAFAEAVKFIGVKESPPGTNRQMFGEWYRMNGEPWCAIFDSYCFAHSGYDRFRYSYVPQIYQDARAGTNGLRVVWTPRRGDLALYDWGGEQLAHVAFYDRKINADSFKDLGGNTGTSDLANGGEVARGTRYTSQVHAYVRVG